MAGCCKMILMWISMLFVSGQAKSGTKSVAQRSNNYLTKKSQQMVTTANQPFLRASSPANHSKHHRPHLHSARASTGGDTGSLLQTKTRAGAKTEKVLQLNGGTFVADIKEHLPVEAHRNFDATSHAVLGTNTLPFSRDTPAASFEAARDAHRQEGDRKFAAQYGDGPFISVRVYNEQVETAPLVATLAIPRKLLAEKSSGQEDGHIRIATVKEAVEKTIAQRLARGFLAEEAHPRGATRFRVQKVCEQITDRWVGTELGSTGGAFEQTAVVHDARFPFFSDFPGDKYYDLYIPNHRIWHQTAHLGNEISVYGRFCKSLASCNVM